jgi:hypothetical protein
VLFEFNTRYQSKFVVVYVKLQSGMQSEKAGDKYLNRSGVQVMNIDRYITSTSHFRMTFFEALTLYIVPIIRLCANEGPRSI